MTITAYQQYAADNQRQGWRRATFNVTDFGAKGDGVTDDTAAIQVAINVCAAAGGGRVVFPITGSPYLIAGPLKDTAGANAQIVLPVVDYVAEKQITIVLEGEIPAPMTYSVIGGAPAADGHTVLKSTHAGTGNVFGALGPTSAFSRFTNLMVDLRNLTLRMPPNPAGVGFNLGKVSQARIDGVSVDTGDYSVSTLVEPQHLNSLALRLPGHNNGAYVHVNSFGACGVYNAVEIAEHAHITELTSYGCKVAVLNVTEGHTCHIERLNVHHQPYGVRTTAKLRMDIANFNIEHASTPSWRTNVYDVDDADNKWLGTVRYGIGEADPIFKKNGGASVTTTNIGDL